MHARRRRWSATALVAGSVLWMVGACGSDVSGSGEGSAAGSGGGVDQGCYDACIAKGSSDAECVGWCSDSSGKSTTSTGSDGKTTSAGAGAGDVSSSGVGGGYDIALEKSCFECWENQAAAGACLKEYADCDASLACIQLRNCPFTCGDKPSCIDECNVIIPSGVDALAALAQCMACNAGPCAPACEDSLTLDYCN